MGSKKTCALLLAAIFLISVVSFQSATVKAQTRTLVVPDQYPTIQEAIDQANAGDTVFVKYANYTVSTWGLTINKSITLLGDNSKKPFISPTPSRAMWLSATINVEADNVSISGFDVENGATAISVEASGCRIINNEIINGYNNGISCSGTNNLISENNISDNPVFGIYITANDTIISQNYISNNGFAGIIVDSGRNLTVSKNSIISNGNEYSNIPSTEKGGLILKGNGPFYVEQNNITGNHGLGIRLAGCNNAIIYGNNVVGNEYGVYLLNYVITRSGTKSHGFGNQVYGNNIANNNFNAIVQHTYSYPLNKSAGDIGNVTDIARWDNGSLGNYWSDYSGQGSYVIDQNNVDHYPLTTRVDINTDVPIPTPAVPELTYCTLSIVALFGTLTTIALVFRKNRSSV